MPTIQNGDATIYYEEFGQGFPILTFAPAGLLSTIEVWSRPSAPVNPTTEFATSYRVIASDQRNSPGQSRAPITAQDGWQSYAADHVAILDHLGIEKCHLYGQCIGGPFIWSLLKAQPERFVSAIVAQPIGSVGEVSRTRSGSFAGWVETLNNHAEATDGVLDAFYWNLYGAGFGYSADRDFIKSCQTPCLVLAGNDAAHPYAIAEEIAQLLPHAEFIPEWKEGEPLAAAKARMHAFLKEHTPA